MQQDERYMRICLEEARAAAADGEVPVGAVLVRGDRVLARSHNHRESDQDPTAHAEMAVLRAAALELGSWRLLDCTLYVSLEPCAMCAGAVVLARVPRVVFGAFDPKAGAGGSVLDVLRHPRLNHSPDVRGGVLASECGAVLVDFFASRRRAGKTSASAPATGPRPFGDDPEA